MTIRKLFTLCCFTALFSLSASGDTGDYLKKPHNWFDSDDASEIAANILSWQSEAGGWPKNIDVAGKRYAGNRDALKGTFDNSATTDEMRFLARIYDETHEREYLRAFERGFDYIIDAQYKTGGWPQFYPPGKKYHRHITFNDGAMVRLMNFLREIFEDEDGYYDFLDSRREKAAKQAFEKGIACILKCQIKVDGKPTAWCAQHDEISYEPRSARSFELAELSGSESVGIVRLLMSLDDPEDEVIKAVDAAVVWFREVKIERLRVDRHSGDKVVVKDDDAPPLWARFYEIGTNRPIYCGRDGVKKYRLDEIDFERRNGYSWLGIWPRRLLEKEYPAWKTKHD